MTALWQPALETDAKTPSTPSSYKTNCFLFYILNYTERQIDIYVYEKKYTANLFLKFTLSF